MSISLAERIHSHGSRDTSDSLGNIPLKAVAELSSIHDPFKQLAHAARLHDILPDDEAAATLDPLIDSSSSELVDTLSEVDRRRRLPSGDPEHLAGSDDGVYLRADEVIASFEAHDAHPSPQTEKLVGFAIDHAVSNDLRATFANARNHANSKGIPMMDALDVVRSQPSSFEPNAITDGYDWLFDKKSS